MPLIFDSDFPIVASYNITPDGGAKIKGNADVEVVHNKIVDNKTQEDALEYIKYANDRVENS